MKYIEEFRDPELAQNLAKGIAEAVDPGRDYAFMEFCGGHTHAIARYGVEDLLPDNIRMIHGPGCPVCVLPVARVDKAIALATDHDVILCTYADLMRVPGSKFDSLIKARSRGADIRMVYSVTDALKIAEGNPDRQVVFFAIGFETTTPPTAVALRIAKAKGLKNFSVHCNHVLTPAAMRAILGAPGDPTRITIDGFVGPSHVSAVIGMQPYHEFTEDYAKPVVIAGFEPLDVMQAILQLVQQVNDGRADVENEYARAVTEEGNAKAIALMDEVFDLRDSFEWRGLGSVPHSALKIAPDYAGFDAELRFDVQTPAPRENKACACGDVLRGEKTPEQCKLYGDPCTPENPLGACMVSSEGACAAQWTYGRFRQQDLVAE
ncbi:hydrogenase formation protein HypD [Alisedimentitalea sp. MJ-SS2]|uniref:hydrogenase formation protein HypD n=1 Tax=Aliisedimentitalea sp. MJ-SS2 TaxID=3049795 RepID=UPI00290A9F8F|nr:hydrogenase formation protein HypD [Alisedimentitalea sp. MJ-SS2]MDU8925777.1 hydrogenase formation protein HypD [Alisedimentitalea sp. MJ-SS2]